MGTLHGFVCATNFPEALVKWYFRCRGSNMRNAESFADRILTNLFLALSGICHRLERRKVIAVMMLFESGLLSNVHV